MTTIEEIDLYHCDNFVGKNSSSFIFRPEKYKTYGAARKAIRELIGPTGYTLLNQKEKEIVGRWSLVTDTDELNNLFNANEQEIIRDWHHSQILKTNSSKEKEISSHTYQIVDTILYNGLIANEICQISITTQAEQSGTTYDVRVYDSQNSQVIIEKTDLSNTDMNIIHLYDANTNQFLNQPFGDVEIEIHIRKTAGSGKIFYSSTMLEYI
jgi:hypothetical protein